MLSLLLTVLASLSPGPAFAGNAVADLRAYGVEISEKSEAWTPEELNTLLETFELLPLEYRQLQKPVEIRKNSGLKKQGETQDIIGEFDNNLGGYEITLYPATYAQWLGTSTPEIYLTALRRAFIHELTHALDKSRDLSSSKEWKRLSGWQEFSPFWVNLFNYADNRDDKGFARPYGEENPEEDLATYAEEFFVPVPHRDAERMLKCRSPSKYRYFKNLFATVKAPGDAVNCKPVKDWVNPDDVEAVELLLASPSTLHPASVAGHIMLRFRMRAGAVSDDPVLMFGMETVPGVSTAGYLFGGLVGKYLSVLDEGRLSDMVIKYTEGEDRDLFRYELTITAGQKRALIERFYEARLNYRYKYRFFTSNCSTMLVGQIGIALGDDKLIELPGAIESPHLVIARMTQLGYAREIAPSFYSISRKALIARKFAQPLFAQLSFAASSRKVNFPTWDELHSSDVNTRAAAYEKIKLAAPLLGAGNLDAAYKVLILSLEEERKQGAVAMKGVIAPTAAHPVLRRALYETRQSAEVKPHFAELNSDMDLGELQREDELAARMTGSAHTGTRTIMVTPTYTIAARSGHLELALDMAAYAQHMGDPSRFALFRGMEMELLASRIVVQLDDPTISRWQSTIFSMRQLPAVRTADADIVESLFKGGGVGVGVKVLELSGNKWTNAAFEAHWLTPQIITDLITSEGFRSYLTLAVGLELGSIWTNDKTDDPDSQDRSWVGTPVELKGQLSFDKNENTLIQAGVSYTPRFNTQGRFEQSLKARVALSQRLGELFGTELRLTGAAEYEAESDLYHFMLGLEGRRY